MHEKQAQRPVILILVLAAYLGWFVYLYGLFWTHRGGILPITIGLGGLAISFTCRVVLLSVRGSSGETDRAESRLYFDSLFALLLLVALSYGNW
jgi:hypothetical protein